MLLTAAFSTENSDISLEEFNVITTVIGKLRFKVFAPRAAYLWFDSRLCRGDFSGSSHQSSLKLGTPVAALAL